jgi:uncharacterized Zn-finger protein
MAPSPQSPDRRSMSHAMPAGNQPANAQTRYEVTRADLPLSCPMPSMTLWNSHPKVFLPIEATGEAKCPYCGAQFVLTG